MSTTTTPWEVITPQQLAALRQSGTRLRLIDVRTPAEFQEVHVPFAENIPLDQLHNPEAIRSQLSGQDPVYVICRSGSRAKMACEKLASAGVERLILVEGGTQAWEQAGLPVVRGRKVMSLERQVRIAAGSLVLLGSVLAVTVHPYFAVLSAFIGAGLVYAGLTDTCGMAMLLAKMPWNQSTSAGSSSCSACSG